MKKGIAPRNNNLDGRFAKNQPEMVAESHILRQELIHTKGLLNIAEKTIKDLKNELEIVEKGLTSVHSGTDNNGTTYLRAKVNDQIYLINKLEVELDMEKKEKNQLDNRLSAYAENDKANEGFFKEELDKLKKENFRIQLQSSDEKKKFIEYVEKMSNLNDKSFQEQIEKHNQLKITIDNQRIVMVMKYLN